MPVHIVDLSDSQFKNIMKQPQFALPIRWDGRNFESTLKLLLDDYEDAILQEMLKKGRFKADEHLDMLCTVSAICSNLMKCVRYYHLGYPSKAFSFFQEIMKTLVEFPVNVYGEHGWSKPLFDNELQLFRLRKASDTAKHERKEMFHVPSGMRSSVSTCRYSIAGYPSLYLTTSIELGLDELGEKMLLFRVIN